VDSDRDPLDALADEFPDAEEIGLEDLPASILDAAELQAQLDELLSMNGSRSEEQNKRLRELQGEQTGRTARANRETEEKREQAANIELTIVTAEEFAAVDEPGAEPIVGEEGQILIPKGGDVMFYGDGGAAKTTLSIDLACHITTGTEWLGYPVPSPVNVHLIENEGPRALFRSKLRHKLEKWEPGARLTVQEAPWAAFTFAEPEWRQALAKHIDEREIDVLLVGPLTRIGMNAGGTLQEVNAFMAFVKELRGLVDRPLTVILIHHENKGGTVSGAWEGASDTLLHCEKRGNGFTDVHVQKARWASASHDTTLRLAWTDGAGFMIRAERDYPELLRALLSDGTPRTVKEMKEALEAAESKIKEAIGDHPETFVQVPRDENRTFGRRADAKLFRLADEGGECPA
jgi:AAA domain